MSLASGKILVNTIFRNEIESFCIIYKLENCNYVSVLLLQKESNYYLLCIVALSLASPTHTCLHYVHFKDM